MRHTRVVAVVHGSCTSGVLLAVESPVGATHLPECTATRLNVLVAPATVTGVRVNCWFVWLLQVYWMIFALSAVDRPDTSMQSPATEVTLYVAVVPAIGVN